MLIHYKEPIYKRKKSIFHLKNVLFIKKIIDILQVLEIVECSIKYVKLSDAKLRQRCQLVVS